MIDHSFRRSLAPAILLGALGCGQSATVPPPPPVPTAADREARRPSYPDPAREVPSRGGDSRFTGLTAADRRFADFLRDKSGGMVKQASVALEDRGEVRVEMDGSAAPEDTLPLTKSLLAGARKDFPDRPITISVYDPGGEPILKARYRPDQGVQYKIAHGGDGDRAKSEQPAAPPASDALSRGGVTEADRKFAAWAEEHGRDFLRYVEADLERHGRIWFGITRQVEPKDVPDLTRSLLEGASKEFPRRELVATVFDPDGEQIGKAHLDRRGKVTWEH